MGGKGRDKHRKARKARRERQFVETAQRDAAYRERETAWWAGLTPEQREIEGRKQIERLKRRYSDMSAGDVHFGFTFEERAVAWDGEHPITEATLIERGADALAPKIIED